MERKEISLTKVLNYLNEGVTKKKTSTGYIESVGSLEEKLLLSPREIDILFKNPLLKNAKTKIAPPFVLIDDREKNEELVENEQQEVENFTEAHVETDEEYNSRVAEIEGEREEEVEDIVAQNDEGNTGSDFDIDDNKEGSLEDLDILEEVQEEELTKEEFPILEANDDYDDDEWNY